MNAAAVIQEAEAALAAQNTTTAAVGEYLSFRFGAEECGMDILKVQAIRSDEAASGVVNAPSLSKVVRNLRGVIVPIIEHWRGEKRRPGAHADPGRYRTSDERRRQGLVDAAAQVH